MFRYLPFIILMMFPAIGHAQQTVGLFFNLPEAYDGYTLIAGTGSDTTYLIDNCGRQVHKWDAGIRPGLAAYLLPNGNLLRTGRVNSAIFSGGGSGGLVQQYDWDGNLLWDFPYSDGNKHQHHDIEPMPNGNVLILSWGFRSAELAVLNGRNPAEIGSALWPTTITEIEPVYPNGGNIVWEWTVWDHLVQDFDSTLANYGVVANHPELMDLNYSSNGNADWMHCNAVDYNAALDQIVISSRKSSEMYVIDHSTTWAEATSHQGGNHGKGGDFLYRWGNPMNYNRGDETDMILSGPHDIHWIPDSLRDGGKFMIFNNGGGASGSAVNIFTPPINQNGEYTDPGTDAYGPDTVDWHFEQVDFFSATVSGAQRQPNGNTLITEGSPGRIFELDSMGNTVWKYINPSAGSGNIAQGNPSTQNAIFRGYRYPANFPAFEGRDLTPGDPIELNPLPLDCQIYPEPVDTNVSVPNAFSDIKIKVSTLVHNQIRIENMNNDEIHKAQLYSVRGVLLNEYQIGAGTNWMDVSHLSNGIYLLILSSHNGQVLLPTRIVKQ